MDAANDIPPDAVRDMIALVSLDEGQFRTLIEAFRSPDSIPPVSELFVGQVAASLQVDKKTAKSICVVSVFLLSLQEQWEGDVSEMIERLEEDVLASVKDDDREAVAEKFEARRDVLAAIATPSPVLLRHRKIHTLVQDTVDNAEGFRTICQLRPLFEGPDNAEDIAGLVPLIQMEVRLRSENEFRRTITFALTESKLRELEQVVSRTKAKMDAIRVAYGDQILSTN